MLSYTHAERATVGARSYQEDAVLVWAAPPPAEAPEEGTLLLTVLADGMGGHVGGALASRTVCEWFVAVYTRSAGPTHERLAAALESANTAIALKVEAQPNLSGMGSTLIGAAFGPDGLEWISVGDSPMYLVRRGEIAALNEDHSLAPALDRMAAEGRITAEQALSDPRRHMLRSAVTGEDIELVDRSHKPLALEPGDHVVLASDGILTIDPDEIARVVSAYADDSPEAIATALIRAVEQAGEMHQDNTTVVVVRATGSTS